MKNALIICCSSSLSDERPGRFVKILLSKGFNVEGFSKIICEDECIRNLYPSSTKFNLFQKGYLKVFAVLSRYHSILPICLFRYNFYLLLHGKALANILKKRYELIVIEDYEFLSVIGKRISKLNIIFDAREAYHKQFEDNYFFKNYSAPLIVKILKFYVPLTKRVLTVSNGLAEEYKRITGKPAYLFRSVPFYHNLSFKFPGKKIKIVHVGVANRNRKIERMLEISNLLSDRFEPVDFYLVGNNEYIHELSLLKGQGTKFRICNPLKREEIIEKLNSYDIGLFYVEPSTFNLKHCLPNKIFQYIQACLCVAIGPSPDMVDIIKRYNCGVYSKSFDTHNLAKVLNEIPHQEIFNFKKQSQLAAKELCMEREWDNVFTSFDTLS